MDLLCSVGHRPDDCRVGVLSYERYNVSSVIAVARQG